MPKQWKTSFSGYLPVLRLNGLATRSLNQVFGSPSRFALLVSIGRQVILSSFPAVTAGDCRSEGNIGNRTPTPKTTSTRSKHC